MSKDKSHDKWHFSEALMREDMLQARESVEIAEYVPVLSREDEEMLLNEDVPQMLPVLPLRNNILMPGVVLPIAVDRVASRKVLKEAGRGQGRIAVIAQRNDVDDPKPDDLYEVGVMARVLRVVNMPGDTLVGILLGVRTVKVLEYHREDSGRLLCTVESVPETKQSTSAAELRQAVKVLRRNYAQILKNRNMPGEELMRTIKGDRTTINFIANHLEIDVHRKQAVLEQTDYSERAKMVLEYEKEQLDYQRINNEMQDRAKVSIDRQQREYFLNQQMRAIQEELGSSPSDEDSKELLARAEEKHWSDDVRKVFDKELAKLQRLAPQSPDYSVQYNYIDLMLDLPWGEYTTDNLSPQRTREVLDGDHYGIEKVKDRIVEHVALLNLKKDMKSPILCLVGPPGTGKTSLGKSVATALGRKYVRIALGGLHDEAEIRGHRKTYVGAMPGRIIQSLKKANSSNPVFILDEVDKVQPNGYNGDPTSALLEVLDPEQNSAFHDNYLDIDYDLSNVLFIATANSLSTIQPALIDRMEVIELSGYILEEKIEIAQRHLIPKLLKDMGFRKGALTFSREVLEVIINDYTRESGVRQLEHTLAKIMRKRAVKAAESERMRRAVDASELQEMLGLPIHRSEVSGKEPRVGVVTGLAWTSVGGEILFVESSISKGKGILTMTGNLGDVMKESATLAFEYIKANADKFGIDAEQLENSNIHIHVPEGATPKDGPSAGITMFVAMLSAFTRRRVKPSVAMTGEITLRGEVTPVGGIKEKILAAKRAGISDLILCEDNRRDIEEINDEYLKGLEFHYIKEMSEALPLALVD